MNGDDLSVLDVALSFLKSVQLKLVIAVSFCGVAAVDSITYDSWWNAYLGREGEFYGIKITLLRGQYIAVRETIAKINQVILNWK